MPTGKNLLILSAAVAALGFYLLFKRGGKGTS